MLPPKNNSRYSKKRANASVLMIDCDENEANNEK